MSDLFSLPFTKDRNMDRNCDVSRPMYRAGDRILICGRMATVDGLYKDWPTIIKFHYDGETAEHLMISHFHDGPNRHISRGDHV